MAKSLAISVISGYFISVCVISWASGSAAQQIWNAAPAGCKLLPGQYITLHCYLRVSLPLPHFQLSQNYEFMRGTHLHKEESLWILEELLPHQSLFYLLLTHCFLFYFLRSNKKPPTCQDKICFFMERLPRLLIEKLDSLSHFLSIVRVCACVCCISIPPWIR